MTLIAYDRKQDYVLADHIHTFENGRKPFFASKIHRAEGFQFACAGSVGRPEDDEKTIRELLSSGTGTKLTRDVAAIVRLQSGEVIVVDTDSEKIASLAPAWPAFGEYVAIGAGAQWYYAYRADGVHHAEAFLRVRKHHEFCGLSEDALPTRF